MEPKSELNLGKFVGRRLSQLKLITRVLENELDAAKGGRELTLGRDLIENLLDTLSIYVEDCEGASGVQRSERKGMADAKPAVARLN